ncbi:hypothetical protein CO614_01635 [Lysobacteraceae bacterium NML120232]|nr:hypothetical protein CO608_01180 [Xanthomonadaceae bacterium NML08-0793]PJK13398.1 hypothetical protein CO614_01635 [Xanthomonadaceae bacterium NML120232]
MKTIHYLLFVVAVLLAALISLLFYDFVYSNKAEQRTLDYIQAEMSSRNAEQMHELKQLAHDSESIHAAANGASYLKTMIAEFHAEYQRLPTSLRDLNLAPDWTPSSRIKTVTIDDSGAVTIVIDNAHSNGTLVYVPGIHQSQFVEWQCSTPDIRDIGRHLPTCEYTGR